MQIFQIAWIRRAVAMVCIWSTLMLSSAPAVLAFFGNENSPPSFLNRISENFGGLRAEIPTADRLKLVSILVEESLLENRKLKQKIERYAVDVQTKVNGKSVLIPIPKDLSPFEIFEGNAALYHSGLENDQSSQLIGTVLIGDVPIPVVDKNGRLWPTVFPYTDFEKVNYRWDAESERFRFQSAGDQQPEIWHGLIRPDFSSGDLENETAVREQQLIEYFDRNHRVHEGTENFPRKIFHADIPAQSQGLPELLKSSYQNWIDLLEDIVYLRFNQAMVQDVLDRQDFANLIPPEVLADAGQSNQTQTVDLSGVPDIFAKNIIDATTKQYVELHQGYLSELNGNIGNAGRWSPAEVDTTIRLVSEKDQKSAEILKNFNDRVEEILFQAAQDENIANDISLIAGGTIRQQDCLPAATAEFDYSTARESGSFCVSADATDFVYFPEYWNGIPIADFDEWDSETGENLTSGTVDFPAENCSLLRGNVSGQLVEMNRTFALDNLNQSINTDEYFCDETNGRMCCGQLADENGTTIRQTEQCRFEDLADFDLDFSAESFDDFDDEFYKFSYAGSAYPFYFEQQPLFSRTGAQALTESDGGEDFIGAKGCEAIIWEKQEDLIDSSIHADVQANLKVINSLQNHVEPTPETILAQYDSVRTAPAAALPIDNPRGFSFYDSATDPVFHRIEYPNLFAFRELFTDEAENPRKISLANQIDTTLAEKIAEINLTGGNAGKFAGTLFDELWTEFDRADLAEAIVWIDKDLEQKNIEMLTGALLPVSQAQNQLLDDDFDGYEYLQLRADPTDLDRKLGLEIAFERGIHQEPDGFIQAELAALGTNSVSENSAEFLGVDALTEIFGQSNAQRFETENGEDLADSDEEQNCNRKGILSWPGSCLIPWLADLPNIFSDSSLVTFSDAESLSEPEIHPAHINNQNIPRKLKLIPAELIIPVGQSIPQKVTVQVLDEFGEVVSNDFQTQIKLEPLESDAQRFLSVVSPETQTVESGKADFFFNATAEKFGSQFFLKFSSSNPQTSDSKSSELRAENPPSVSLPVRITQSRLALSLPTNQIKAGRKEPIPIEIRAVDQTGATTRDFDGKVIQLSTEKGNFSHFAKASSDARGKNSVVLKDGRAVVSFFPGTEAGETQIEFRPSAKTLAPNQLKIQILPSDPAKFQINEAVQFWSEDVSREVEIDLIDAYGNEILENSAEFFSPEITADGVTVKKISNKTYELKLESGAEAVSLLADSEKLSLEPEPTAFQIFEGLQLTGEFSALNVRAGSDESIELEIAVRDSDGLVIPTETEGFLSGPTTEKFPRKIPIRAGRGKISIQPGTVTGRKDFAVIIPGIPRKNFTYNVQAGTPSQLSITSEQKLIDRDKNEPYSIQVHVLDEFENLVSDASQAIFLQINPEDEVESDQLTILEAAGLGSDRVKAIEDAKEVQTNPNGTIDSIITEPVIEKIEQDEDTYENPRNFYGMELYPINGIASFEFTPTGENDDLFLIAHSEGLVAATEKIELREVLDVSDFDFLSPKVLLAQIVGARGGDWSRPNIGNQFLFRGETQAVATSPVSTAEPAQVFTVAPDGNVTGTPDWVFQSGPKFSAEISAENLENTGLLARWEVQFGSVARFRFGAVEVTDELPEGFYVQPHPDFSERMRADGRAILFDDQVIARVHDQGGLVDVDPRLEMRLSEKNRFDWDLIWEGELIAKGALKISNPVFALSSDDISQKNSPTSPGLRAASAEIFTVFSKNSEFRSVFTGTSTNAAQGFGFFDTNRTEDRDRQLGFSLGGIENSEEDSFGWEGNWKPPVLFAAQNSAGESIQYGASDALVLLGDPTVSVSSENPKSGLNITEDVGQILWKSSDGPIEEVLAGDLNGDERGEIFARVDDQLELWYQDHDEVDNYRHVGPVLNFRNGTRRTLAYTDFRGKLQHIIHIDGAGRLQFHQNDDGRLIKASVPLGIDDTFLDAAIGEFNGDQYSDILLLGSENTFYIVHGKGNGDFYAPTKLYSFTSVPREFEEIFSAAAFEQTDQAAFEHLPTVLLSFANINAVHGDDELRALGGTDFIPVMETIVSDASFEIERETDKKIRGKFQFQPTTRLESLEILIPTFAGIETDISSFKCNDCVGDFQIEDAGDFVRLSGVSVEPRETLAIEWTADLIEVPAVAFLVEDFSGQDGIDDIGVAWTGDTEEAQFFQFISNDTRKQYPTSLDIFTDPISQFFQNLQAQIFSAELPRNNFEPTHTLRITTAFPENELPPLISGDADEEAIAEAAFDALAAKGSGDLPVAYEDLSIDAILNGADCGGACGLPIPSYAFLAPGSQSVYVPPFGFPGPVNPIGPPLFWLGSILPFVYGGPPNAPTSLFRIYVMPTTTAQVGVGLCVGPPTGFSIPPLPVGNCFVIIPPILEIAGACPADLLGIENSPALRALQTGFSGGNTGTFSLENRFKPSNQKIYSSDIITTWVQQQFEEINNFKLPSVTIKLPEFAQKKSPSTGSGQSAENSESEPKNLIERLESSDFIRLTRRPVRIPYPSFATDQLIELKDGWRRWKVDYNAWKKDQVAAFSAENPDVTTLKNNALSSVDQTFQTVYAREKSATQALLTESLVTPLMAQIDTSSANLSEMESVLASGKELTSEQLTQYQQAVSLQLKVPGIVSELEKIRGNLATSAEQLPTAADLSNLRPEEQASLTQVANDARAEIKSADDAMNEKVSALKARQMSPEKLRTSLENLEKIRGNVSEGSLSDIPSLATIPEPGSAIFSAENLAESFRAKIDPSVILDSLDQTVTSFESNLSALDSYAETSRQIQELPEKVETTLRQTEESLNVVNDYLGNWREQNEVAAEGWQEFRRELVATLKVWESIPNIFKSLSATCKTCHVNRGSILEWFLRVLLGGIKLPVIPMPQMADIELDLSRLDIGTEFAIPEITLEPVPLSLPSVPDLPELEVRDLVSIALGALVLKLLDVDFGGLMKPLVGIFSAEILQQLVTGSDLPNVPIDQLIQISAEPFRLDQFEMLGVSLEGLTLSQAFDLVFNLQFEALSYDVVAGIPGVSDIALNVPILPELPILPNLSQFDLDLRPPSISLPSLPLLLPPPRLPNWLKPLQAVVMIPRPLFQFFCLLMLGFIPVPEWKLASTVQERTNRTSLLPLDFGLSASFPLLPKKTPETKRQEFSAEFSPGLTTLNQTIDAFGTQMKCAVDQIGAENRGGETGSECEFTLSSADETAVSNTPSEITFAVGGVLEKFSPENTKLSEKQERLLSHAINEFTKNRDFSGLNGVKNSAENSANPILASLKNWFTPLAKSSQVSSSWLVAKDIDLSQIPTALTDLPPNPSNLVAEAYYRDQQEEFLAEPAFAPELYWYDLFSDTSETVTKYPLSGRTYALTRFDLDADGEDEILYSIDDELFLKRRFRFADIDDDFETDENILRFDTEDFVTLIAPTFSIRNRVDEAGASWQFDLEKYNPSVSLSEEENTKSLIQIPYYEWLISDRPDIVFEDGKKPADRHSQQWDRVGFAVRESLQKYQIRPSTAQIVRVQGSPQIIGSPLRLVPEFSAENQCTDPSEVKPFYPTETILVAKSDKTRFFIQTKERNGEPPRSFWKTMQAGEETLVDFAEVCVISGELQEVTTSERMEFSAESGNYFSSGMRIAVGEDERVDIEIFNGKEISIFPGETYEIHHFSNENERVKGFRALTAGNHYGIFRGFSDDETSYGLAKNLHDPQLDDDREPPQIRLKQGTQRRTGLFQEIVIDASESTDDSGIVRVEWGTDRPDLDLSDETDLQIKIPGKTNSEPFSVALRATDAAGNSAEKLIQFSIDLPDLQLDEIDPETGKILGRVLPVNQNLPIQLVRERAGRETLVSRVIPMDEAGNIVIEDLSTDGPVQVWQKNLPLRQGFEGQARKIIWEILPTGRPVIYDDRYSVRLKAATESQPMRFEFFNEKDEVVAVNKLSFEKSLSRESEAESNLKVNAGFSIVNDEIWEELLGNSFDQNAALILNSHPIGYTWNVENDLAVLRYDETVIGRLFSNGQFVIEDENYAIQIAEGKIDQPISFEIFDIRSGEVGGEFFGKMREAVVQ